MRILVWIVRAAVFLTLFAFALNNQHGAAVKWFFGYEWQAPMVIIVLVAFGLGCAFGVLAMVPSWWRHRRAARVTPPAATGSATSSPSTPSSPTADVAVPATLHDGV
jgi:putative membrane protein